MKALPPLPTGIDERILAVVGRISVDLLPERLVERIDETLRLLHDTIGADATELHLCDPEGRELSLFAYAGTSPQHTRCAIGQGIAGLTALEARPIVSSNVQDERRLTLHRLDSTGACVSIPLGQPPHLVGVLLATWTSEVDVSEAEKLLKLAAHPIRNAIDATLALHRERVRAAFRPVGSTPPDVDGCMREVLHEMQEVAGFHAATFYMRNDNRQWNLHHVALPANLRQCSTLTESGDLSKCPYLQEGRAIVLYGANRHWPARCRVAGDGTACRTCLPLHMRAPVDAAFRLSYAADPPSPPTRFLASLEVMANEAAMHLQHLAEAAPRSRHALPEAAAETAAREASPDSSRLEFRCFGRLEVERDGQVLDVREFRRHGSITLLKLLLLAAGNPVSKQSICRLLWPGADEAASANRLHGVVHALRQALEPRAKERQWLYICGRGDFYYFSQGAPHTIDFIDFKHAAARGRALEQGGHAGEAIHLLEQAAGLYRGDLFEDDTNADWFAAERETLHDTQVEVLVSLGRLYAEVPDAERSLASLRRALRLAPAREDVHQTLMRLLSRWGRRQEALVQFEDCSAALRQALNGEPLPETVKLRDEILATLRQTS